MWKNVAEVDVIIPVPGLCLSDCRLSGHRETCRPLASYYGKYYSFSTLIYAPVELFCGIFVFRENR